VTDNPVPESAPSKRIPIAGQTDPDVFILEPQVEPYVARISLNRPKVHNALHPLDLPVLERTIQETAERDDVKIIILKGEGPSFCVGDDLTVTPFESFGGKPGQRLQQHRRILGIQRVSRVMHSLSFVPKPVIIQAHGKVMGLGLFLCLAADLVISSQDAVFSHAEQRIGFGGHNPFTNSLSILHLGPKRAREWLLTGRSLDAETAERWGLVNEIVSRQQLDVRTLEWARALTMHPMDGLVIGKLHHQITLDNLGVTQSYRAGTLSHPLFTNLVYGDDEWNFIGQRNKTGLREAFAEREARWEEAGF
jgi:enoyl-CoA hydratase